MKATAQNNYGQLGQRVENIWRQASNEFGDLDRQARTLVDQRPLLAVLSAIALGFAFARITARV